MINLEEEEDDSLFAFGWKENAGLIAIYPTEKLSIHLFVQPSHWVWGWKDEECDLIGRYYGFGPFFMIFKIYT